jgi:hypothetical protein
MIFYSSGSNTSVSGISFPFPGSDGAIPVSKDGQWSVGVDKDPKANSVEAATQLTANEFTGSYLNIQTLDQLQGIIVQPDSITVADLTAYSGTGGGVVVANDGIYILQGMNFIHLTREQLVALTEIPTSSGSSVDPRTNGGRLAVTPAYMNTASDSAFQANTTDDQILFGWTQEVAHEIAALSIYVTAVGTQGNITLKLYTADSDGEPDTLVFDIGTVDSGASADAWIRKTFTAQQLYPGKRYCIVASVAADKDVSFSYNRQDTGQQSGLVPGCWSKSTVNGGTDWTDLTKDSQPALLNIVLASTENHVPQLVYGWTGKAGNKVALYSEDTSAWVLYTIPDAGLVYGAEMDDTVMGVWIYDGGGGPELYLGNQEKGFQDGIEVYAETSTDRFLGLVSGLIRVSTHYGPIRCETYNTLWNAENQTEQVMYRQPYAGDAYATGSNTVWQKAANNDDFTITCLVGPNTIYTAIGRVIIASGCPNSDFAIMIDVAGTPIVGRNNGGQGISSWSGDNELNLLFTLSEGVHSIFLMSKETSATNQYFYFAGNCWSHRGSYMG